MKGEGEGEGIHQEPCTLAKKLQRKRQNIGIALMGKCGPSVQAFYYTDQLTETLVVRAGRGGRVLGGRRTFTRGGSAVVFEVGAVLALVVLWAGTEVVCGQVEAGRPVLTRVGGAVIDIQLWEERYREESGEPDS